MTRWLVLGARGQLGSDLVSVLQAGGRHVVAMDVPDVDICDAASVATAMADSRPDVVANCAAYTAVDQAESDEETALAVNGRGPDLIAQQVALRPSTRLIHISTDYVFSGDARTPYPEDGVVGPASAYGRTKLAGERAVRAVLPDRGFIVRTAWLYGAIGTNFVKTMLTLASTDRDVPVVTDQVGQPTWSRDLAVRLEQMISAKAPAGIYHGTNSGACSWYEFAREIFRLAGADPDRVRPTTSQQFSRPAPRPAYSVLGHSGWEAAGLGPMRNWAAAAGEAVPLIAANAVTDGARASGT